MGGLALTREHGNFLSVTPWAIARLLFTGLEYRITDAGRRPNSRTLMINFVYIVIHFFIDLGRHHVKTIPAP